MAWASQGVLLLNATLTVRAHQAGSHQKKGWETFTDAIIKTISGKLEGVVFLLWGGFAKKKASLIDQHFSKTNALLVEMGKEPIVW